MKYLWQNCKQEDITNDATKMVLDGQDLIWSMKQMCQTLNYLALTLASV